MVEENPLFEHLLPSVRATATPGYDPKTDPQTPFFLKRGFWEDLYDLWRCWTGTDSKIVPWKTCDGSKTLKIDCPNVPGFEYWVCIGYDAGDLYYDDASTLEELRNQFEKRVSGPLRSEGVVARVVFMRWGEFRV
jgi:hypothetical protein